MKKLFDKLIKYRLTIIFLLLCIVCGLHISYGNNIMALFGLKWRPWVITATFGLFSLFKYAFLTSIVIKIVKWGYKKYIEKPNLLKEAAAVICGVLFLMAAFYIIFLDLFLMAMMHKPEHIVIRDNKKCVACVTSWHGSSVSCHEYKGIFFMGEDTVSYEIYNYSNDPFGSGAAPYN